MTSAATASAIHTARMTAWLSQSLIGTKAITSAAAAPTANSFHSTGRITAINTIERLRGVSRPKSAATDQPIKASMNEPIFRDNALSNAVRMAMRR